MDAWPHRRPIVGRIRAIPDAARAPVGDTDDVWFVVLIVFVTMFAVQAAQFAWIEFLLRRIDVLEQGGPEPVADSPHVDDPAGKAGRGQLAAHA